MTKKKQPTGSGPNTHRAQRPPKISSAPHQTKNPGNAVWSEQYVLTRKKPQETVRRNWLPKWTSKAPEDLPPGLFPEGKKGNLGKWALLIVIPLVAFVMIYTGANVGAALVESETIKQDSAPHWGLCTGIDMAIAAGFDFEPQFTRAKCKKNWGRGAVAAPNANTKQEEAL